MWDSLEKNRAKARLATKIFGGVPYSWIASDRSAVEKYNKIKTESREKNLERVLRAFGKAFLLYLCANSSKTYSHQATLTF